MGWGSGWGWGRFTDEVGCMHLHEGEMCPQVCECVTTCTRMSGSDSVCRVRAGVTGERERRE